MLRLKKRSWRGRDIRSSKKEEKISDFMSRISNQSRPTWKSLPDSKPTLTSLYKQVHFYSCLILMRQLFLCNNFLIKSLTNLNFELSGT